MRLPAAVYYDLDNTAVEHGAHMPSPETVEALGSLSSQGVETVAVTGRDIDDARDALVVLPGRFAIIAGGATTTFIKHEAVANTAEVIPTARLGLGFGYEVLDDVGALMIAGQISDWLDAQAAEHDATIRIPAFERQAAYLEDVPLSDEKIVVTDHFSVPDAVFVSNLSSHEAANELALFINNDGLGIPHRPLFAVPVNSQTGKPEVQITAIKANKREAIERLASLGLPIFNDNTCSGSDTLAESVYIGDGLGDLPAFEVVALSVAMADAPKEVLGAADHIIDSQRKNGFVKFVQKLASP